MSVNGGRGKGWPLPWLLGLVAIVAGGIAWRTGQGWAAVVLAALAVFLPVADLLVNRRRAQADDLDLEKVADRLALAVRKQWADEAKRREITSPPLAVSWQPASPSLVQSWSYLQQLAGDGAGWPTPTATATGPQDLAGGGPQILTAYDRTPCGRLVVLGEPGAGKTVLLIRLVLDLLARRQPGEPVPLLLPLASWNPDGQSLTDWLEGQILREYPHLVGAISAGGKTRARALLDDGLILPVLDGLDEIRGGSRTQALAKINATLGNHTGIVLSCRAKAFRHAVRPGPGVGTVRLEGAAGVRLDPLAPLAVAEYLIATAGEGGQTRWAAVRFAVTSPGTPLTRTLVTPLMASLARTIYNPRDGESTLGLPNPADLTALPTATAIEDHLLAGFAPAAYRPHPDQPTRWTSDQATRYLVFLARHLEHHLHTTSLAWWELRRATPRAVSMLALALVLVLVVGLVVVLVVVVPATPAFVLAAGFTLGLGSGLGMGLSTGIVMRGTARRAAVGPWDRFSPSQVALRRPRRSDLGTGLAIGLAIGLAFGLGIGLNGGLPAGLAIGLAAGLAAGFVPTLGLNTTADTRHAADPRTVLIQDRTSALAFGVAFGLLVGLATAFGLGLDFGTGLGTGAGAGLGLGTAWGQLSLARLWLAARRQQPLHLISFLEDAHARGVLRQAGAVWEFRHANLQRYLAGPP